MLKLVQPWPDPYTINARSPYGPRKHPITGKVTFHHGIDVAMPQGTPLTAGADGVVAHKGSGGSGGYTLLLRHTGGMHTVYYHLQKASHLAVGAAVRTGDVVAYSGNTGASTGPHLHYELRRSKRWGDTIDPAPHIVKPQSVPDIVKPQLAEPPAPVAPAKPFVPPWMQSVGIPHRLKTPDRFQQLRQRLRGRRG